MVDVWLIFCIGITFLTIIFHVVVDMVVSSSSLGTQTNTIFPRILRVTPQVWKAKSDANEQMKRKSSQDTSNSHTKFNTNTVDKSVVMLTKLAVPTVFFLFNVIYWPYILC